MKSLRFFSPALIGIDIQAQTMRLVQLRKIKNYFCLERAVKSVLPSGVIEQSKVKHWDYILSQLMEWVKQWNLQLETAAINLPANLVRMQHLQLPLSMSTSVIEAEIQAQLERDFPSLDSSLAIDFNVIKRKELNYTDVYFVATRQDYLSKLMQCINDSGLKLKIVDVDVYSIKRIFDYSLPLIAQSNTVNLLFCHYSDSFLLLVQENHEIIFYQQWDFSETMTLSLQLKNKIQIFKLAYPNKIIKNCLLYNIQDENKAIGPTLNETAEVILHYPDLLSGIKINQESYQDDSENLRHYLPALGLAMRAIPLC